jgi:hypothetical protein
MELTFKDYDILLESFFSDRKEEIVNQVCLEIQKDPFSILNYNPQILRNLSIRDMLSKREHSLFAKDFPQEEQEKIINRYVIMAPYIKNITPKTLLSIINIHAEKNTAVFSPYHCLSASLFYNNKDKVNQWNSEERMLAISKWPEIIGLFYDIQYNEIVLAISQKGCLINNTDLPTSRYINDPFLRLLSLKNDPYIISEFQNPTLEELRIAFSMDKDAHKSLLKEMHNLPEEIIDLCLEEKAEAVLENYPQTVDICLKALKIKPDCWPLIKIAQGICFDDVLKYLNEKKNIINLIGE